MRDSDIVLGQGYFEPGEVIRAKGIAQGRVISRLNSWIIKPDQGRDPRVQRFVAIHLIQDVVDEALLNGGVIKVWERKLLLPEGYQTGIYEVDRQKPSQITSLRRAFDFIRTGNDDDIIPMMDSVGHAFKGTAA